MFIGSCLCSDAFIKARGALCFKWGTPWLPSSYGPCCLPPSFPIVPYLKLALPFLVALFGSSPVRVRHWQSHNSSKGPRFPRSSPSYYNFLLTLFLFSVFLFFERLLLWIIEIAQFFAIDLWLSGTVAVGCFCFLLRQATAGSPDSGSDPMPGCQTGPAINQSEK